MGLLIFARAASRESDLVVRTALGAGRGRIVWQLFTEALVLGGLAATVGIGAAAFVLQRWGIPFLETNIGRLPFWTDLSLSPRTIVFAIAFTVFGCAVAGVMPAFKLTRGMNDRLKQSAGSGGLQFGGVWTVIIVAQIAVTMLFPAIVYGERLMLGRVGDFDMGFAAEEYLTALIEKDSATEQPRFAQSLEELQTRLAATPGVTGVTFAQSLPATGHPERRIELAGGAGAATYSWASLAAVAPSYFEALESPVIAGRAFAPADVQSGARVAIVDQGFVDLVLQGRNPIGQQLRFAPQDDGVAYTPEPWYEVVGLVKELGLNAPFQRAGRVAGFYLPGAPERLGDQYLMVHLPSGDPATFGPRLREIATAVDSTLKVSEVRTADALNTDIVYVMSLWLRITSVMAALAVVLSLAGIYAVLSFTVSRRTREIGVRVALGGSRERVIGAILRKPLMRVGFGVLVGGALVLAAVLVLKNSEMPGADTPLTVKHFAMIAGYVVVMVAVCSLAVIVPARRALRVEPTVALRAE